MKLVKTFSKISLLLFVIANTSACVKETDVRDQYVGWYFLTSNYNYGEVVQFDEGRVLNIQKGLKPDELYFSDAVQSGQLVKLSGSDFKILPYQAKVKIGDSEVEYPIQGEGEGRIIDGKLKFTKTIQMIGTDKKCTGIMTTSERL